MRLNSDIRCKLISKARTCLFESEEAELKERRSELAKENYDIYWKSRQHLLNTEITDHILKHDIVRVVIEYTSPDGKQKLSEQWRHRSNDSLIQITLSDTDKLPKVYEPISAYVKPYVLEKELYSKAKELCDDILVHQDTKEKVLSFVDKSLKRCNTIKQLKALWPQSMHGLLTEYEQVSKPKKPKKPKTAENPANDIDVSEVESMISEQLAENLLRSPNN